MDFNDMPDLPPLDDDLDPEPGGALVLPPGLTPEEWRQRLVGRGITICEATDIVQDGIAELSRRASAGESIEAIDDALDDSETVPPWKEFPVNAFPPSVRDYVKPAGRSIGQAVDYVALPMLGVLASSIGAARKAYAMGSWSQPMILWPAIVAPSGGGKSPGQALALKPLIEENNRLIAEREIAIAAAEKDGGKAPPKKALLSTDATIEGIAGNLAHVPRGMLITQDEVLGVFSGANQYKGGKGHDIEKWLEMYDGGGINITRKSADAPDVVSACVSVCGGIQPEAIHNLFCKNDGKYTINGLAARLSVAMPPENKEFVEFLPPIDPDAEKAVGVVIRGLLDLMPEKKPGEQIQPRLLRFNPEALARFNVLRRKMFDLRQRAGADTLLGKMAPKITGVAVRLAGILHAARSVDPNNDRPIDNDNIDGATMDDALEIAGYLLREARRVYALFDQFAAVKANPDDTAAKVERYINENGGRVVFSEIQRRFFKKKGTKAEHVREWLIKNYIAPGRAYFVNGARGRVVLIMGDPDEADSALDSVADVAAPTAPEPIDEPWPEPVYIPPYFTQEHIVELREIINDGYVSPTGFAWTPSPPTPEDPYINVADGVYFYAGKFSSIRNVLGQAERHVPKEQGESSGST